MRRSSARALIPFLVILAVVVNMVPLDWNRFNASALNEQSIVVAYDLGNGGTINGQSVVTLTAQQGKTIQISNVTQVNTGYHFLGWTTEKNSGSIMYRPGDTVSFNKNTTLWPVWQVNIILDLGDGVFEGTNIHAKTISVVAGRQVIIPIDNPKRDGFLFVEYTPNDGLVSQYQPGDTVVVTEPLYLIARWNHVSVPSPVPTQTPTPTPTPTSAPRCILTYDANGGTFGKDQITKVYFTAGESFNLDRWLRITRDGYKFIGYATQKGAPEASYNKGDLVTFYGNTKLFALWEGTITYDLNGGVLSSGNPIQTITLDSRVELKTPVLKARDGWFLSGWKIVGEAADGKLYKRGDFGKFSQSVVLRAVWKPDPALILPDYAVRLKRADDFVKVYSADGQRVTKGAMQSDFSDFYIDEDYTTDYAYYETLAMLIKEGKACGMFAAFNTAAYLMGDHTYTHEEVREILSEFCTLGASAIDGIEELVEMVYTQNKPGAPWSAVREMIGFMLHTDKHVGGFFDKIWDKLATGVISTFAYRTIGLANRKNSEEKILSMLENDIPVIMSHYGNTDKHPSIYYATKLENGDVYLEKSNSTVDNHYFVIVGAYCSSNGRIKWLEISSWGGIMFLSWEEVWKDGCGQYSSYDPKGFGNAILNFTFQ